MKIWKTAQLAPNYYEINREERNYAAILFAALCKPGNAEIFLRQCGFSGEVGPDFGIYFEYAYLRDLWHSINNNVMKKEIIRGQLKIAGIDEILALPVVDINRKFGVGERPSKDFIQYPGRWAMIHYSKSFKDDGDFLKICKFKWAFNIKPDMVIHLDKDRAICIEAKFGSNEGSYPASSNEKLIFKDRGISDVGQMELQKYMMEELLGIRTDFIFLASKKGRSDTHRVMSWADVFGTLNMEDMPPYAREMVKRISKSDLYHGPLTQEN